MAAYAYHANVLNFEDAEVNRFFCEALFKIGYEESMEALLPTVLKVGEINLLDLRKNIIIWNYNYFTIAFNIYVLQKKFS